MDNPAKQANNEERLLFLIEMFPDLEPGEINTIMENSPTASLEGLAEKCMEAGQRHDREEHKVRQVYSLNSCGTHSI